MAKVDVKLHELETILTGMGSVLVAYSGGVDSTILLKVALDVLGENVLAATIRGPLFPVWELAAAEGMADRLGARHLFIEVDMLDDPGFSSNSPDRCYICKRALFSVLRELAGEHSLREVADGTNYDELGQYRPGLRAIQELAVRSPLAEAGLTKAEVRALSQEMGLPTWDKPAGTCLATRFPYGDELTPEKLRRVEKAEQFLYSLGLAQVRVRIHGALARIEVPRHEMAHLVSEMALEIVDRFRELGYTYVTLDLQGYRTGSMDEVLKDRRSF